MTDRVIIALVGAGNSGKAWAASRLIQNHGFEPVGFLDPVKAMLKTGLGLTDAHFEPGAKGEPLAEYGGVTTLTLMQTLGFGWARKTIGPGTLIHPWRCAVRNAGPRVVVPDLRFPNEEQAVRDEGGVIWEVDRSPFVSNEAACRGLSPDERIKNASTIAALCHEIDKALDALTVGAA